VFTVFLELYILLLVYSHFPESHFPGMEVPSLIICRCNNANNTLALLLS